MNRRAKIGVWVVVIAALVLVFAVTGAKRMKKAEVKSIESVQKSEGIPVDVVKAQVVPLEDWRSFVGVAEGTEQVDLQAPFRTRVNKVHVALGEDVKPGTVIISLDPYDPAWVGMNLESATAAYETARQDSIRTEELFKTGAVSQQDLDHVRAATDVARAHYITSRRAVELDTPIAGVVTALSVRAGDYASSDQTLATVASYSRIRVPLDLSESDRSLVRVGQPVRLKYADGGMAQAGSGGSAGEEAPVEHLLAGTVTRVALSGDAATRLFAVEVTIDNPDHAVRPGSLVSPEIMVAQTKGEPVIPLSAISKSGGQEFVYAVMDSGGSQVARRVAVVQGLADATMAAIVSGLAPGRVVVVWGQNNLEDGVKVKVHQDLSNTTYGPGQ